MASRRDRKAREKRLVRITRSFTYKMNVGNYESRDFFCSQTAECYESEVDAKSEAVHNWCKRQVVEAVNQYRKDTEAI